MATDRQQTMADGKTYGGVDKIFKLSKQHSAAIMINGNADFEEVPMEILISEFRYNTDFTKLDSITEIKDKFIKFISKNTEYSTIDQYITPLLKSFKDDLILEINQEGFDNVINDRKRREICPFIRKYSNFHNEFDDIVPDDKNKEEYNQLLWEIFSYELQYGATGIVIAGYNLKSHYPSFLKLNYISMMMEKLSMKCGIMQLIQKNLL